MLSSSQRLSVEQFNLVMKNGKVTHSPFFMIRFLGVDHNKTKKTKISAVASQKFAKTAYKRNKIRRQIYESVKSFYQSIKPNLYIIIFSKSPVTGLKFDNISKNLNAVFVKSKLLK